MKKKVLKLLVLCVLIFGVYMIINPNKVKAKVFNNVSYEIVNREARVLYNYGYRFVNCDELVIPTVIDGCVVTSIEDGAFCLCNNFTSVTIPGTIESISQGAFRECKNLTSITIGNGVEKIEKKAFIDCDSLQSIVIPDSVTEIKDYAFQDCDKLTDVTLPEKITSLQNTFFKCTSLKKITIPNKVTSMEGAFMGCTSLEEVNIPKGVTNISGAFSNCENLISIELPDSIIEIGKWTFDECYSLRNINIPKNCTTIESFAFYWCENLENIIFPEGLKKIGDSAFYGCKNVKSLIIPNSVTTIYSSAFSRCDNLKKILIPKSITVLQGRMFYTSTLEKPTIIYGYRGSYAENYAKTWEYEFRDAEEWDDYTIDNEGTVHGSFISTNKKFKGDYGYYYNDNYFSKSATEYNASLATMSACVAYSAYNATTDKEYKNEDANIRRLLNECDFKNFEAYNYDQKPTYNNIAFSIANKSLNEETTLIAIAVRGGGYEEEWAGNFIVGQDGDHEGFKTAANIIYKNLESYIENNEITGKIKVWVTGFSRAAATSNLLAAKLNNSSIEKVEFSKNDIYAYCFATPSGANAENNPTSDSYSNIFSIIHYDDPVPLVAPDFWGFEKYGKTLIFPHGTTTQSKFYFSVMKQRFENMGYTYKLLDKTENAIGQITIDNKLNFLNTILHLPSQETISISYPYKKIGNLGKYLRDTISGLNTHEALRSREGYVNLVQTDVKNTIIGLYGDLSDGEYYHSEYYNFERTANSIGYALADILYDGLDLREIYNVLTNLDKLAIAHAEPAYYLAWLQTMDSNYGTNLKPYFENCDGREIIVQTRANIDIYDKNNRKIATITGDGEIEIIDPSVCINMDSDQKIIQLPIDDEYVVKASSNENTTLSYTVREYSGTNLKTTKIVSYQDIEVKKNKEVVSNIGSYSEKEVGNQINGSSAEYVLEKEGSNVAPTVSATGNVEDQQNYQISANCNSEQGKISGADKYKLGSHARLIAQNNEGYEFDGWYENGNKISNECTYEVYVVKDLNLEARYKTCEHKEKIENITKANLYQDGETKKICSICGKTVEKKKLNHINEITLSEKTYEYDGKVKTPEVTVTDSENNIVDSSNYNLTYKEGRINAGNYYVMIKFNEKYYVGQSYQYFTINKANYDLSKVKITNSTITYDGKIHSIIASELPKGVKAEYTNNGKTEVGTYYITASFKGDTTNYNNIEETKTAILKITPKSILKTTIGGIIDKTYTGKAVTQSIVIKDGNKVLKSGKDYIVTYKNNTNVAFATIVITGKGNYTGTTTKTFKINPKGVSLKKVTAGKKQFKVTWNKNTKQTTGYEIQYSTNKNFKSGNKTVKIKKSKTTSSTVKNLKAKKKYYVRIRTYKMINGKSYYSEWSKIKNVTTKK